MKNWLSVDLAFIRHGVTNMSISSEMILMDKQKVISLAQTAVSDFITNFLI